LLGKNKSFILISILIAIFCLSVILWFFSRSKTPSYGTISEQEAIEMIKNQFPAFQEYPSDNLPPKSIKTEKTDEGWFHPFFF